MRSSLASGLAAVLSAASFHAIAAPLTCAPEWQTNGARPVIPDKPAMIYDSWRRRVVLVAGSCHGAGNVWEHDGSQWVAGVPMPSPRQYPALAYDAARGVTVLFGGYEDSSCNYHCGEGFYKDTWGYDGATWSGMSSGPPERLGAAMAYDKARRVVVLQGGIDACDVLSDTWERDGNGWRPAPDGPWAFLHAMAFDEARGRSVLVGDFGTRYYDGSWSVGPALPFTPSEPALAYDAARARTVLYDAGGTWELDGVAWVGDCGSPPGNITDHAMAYDGGHGRIVMVEYFGSSSWEYVPGIELTPATLPSGKLGQAYAADIDVAGIFGYTFSLTAGSLPPGVVLKPSGQLIGWPRATGTYPFEVTASSVWDADCGHRYVLRVAP